MTPHKRNGVASDGDEPAETIVLDELPLMETVEFRRFANLDKGLLNEDDNPTDKMEAIPADKVD